MFIMYAIDVQPRFKKKVKKIKDKQKRRNIWNKMEDIASTLEDNPDHFKNLHPPLHEYKRVHVNGSFVMIFIVDEENKIVTFHNYAHHDDIYNEVP